MPIAKERAVKAALLPYNDRIRGVIDRGFTAFVKKTATGANLYRRTDAAEVSDCIMQEAIAEFDAKPDTRVFQASATSRVLLGPGVLARFKKAGKHRKGTNIWTRANDRYLNPRLAFPDAPEAMKVEICWTLNATGTNYEEILVNGRDGQRVSFSYDLPGAAQETLPFPNNAASPDKKERKSIVKLRVSKQPDGKGKQAS